MITWVLLTRGDRPTELTCAVESILRQSVGSYIVVVANGPPDAATVLPARIAELSQVAMIRLPENLGVPGGRDHGIRASTGDVVAFLDDDAELLTEDANRSIEAAFAADPTLGAVSFRIEDDDGNTQRRHVPRAGAGGADRSGPAATFLGGACAIRRSAYDEAGGYWADLFYAHEELDLSWRLHDRGHRVDYRPDIVVRHPRTPIGRHGDGWTRTGRNRVLVARRNLPLPIMAVHVTMWLILGVLRAPDVTCRLAYVRGWISGCTGEVERAPIRWRTVMALARSGRPPIV